MKKNVRKIFITIGFVLGILFVVWIGLKINYEIRRAVYIRNILREPITAVKGRIQFSSTGREEPHFLFLLEKSKIRPVTNENGSGLSNYDDLKKQGLTRMVIRDNQGQGKKEVILPADYNPFDFDTSPDGQTIVFTSGGGGNFYNLFTIDIEGKNLKQITTFDDSYVNHPKFSPNGKKIVFNGYKKWKNSNGDFYSGARGSWLINTDGTDLKELTGESHWGGIDPAWSPDGNTVVFCSYPEDAKILKYDLYSMNSDGSNIKRITNFKDNFEAVQPCFSPDGKQICFVGKQPGPRTGSELFAVNSDGTNLIRLTPAKQTPYYPYYATDKHPDWGE